MSYRLALSGSSCLESYRLSCRRAPTQIIELENTLNGSIFPQDEIIRISEYAHSQGIVMHLDGARIWHVAAETGTSIEELCTPFDSVSLCFSKGLGTSSQKYRHKLRVISNLI